MQPTRRHVPPRAVFLSMHATFMPSCAARIAATYPPGPAPTTTRSKRSAMSHLEQEAIGILDALLDADEELHGLATVEHAVVVAERDEHDGPDLDLARARHRPLDDVVHAEDRGLRRVEDRGRQHRSVHAAVGDGERAAL